MPKTAAIHQPNFFPWLGFFDKINRADVFVYLDHVKNNPRSALWTKRVKILANKTEHWLTLSLKNKPDEVFVDINKMEVDKPAIQANKHLKNIELNYKKLPFFNEIFPLVKNFYESESPFIAERNINFIESVCSLLEINTVRVKSSSLDCQANSNDLLIELCNKVSADIYMYGGGSAGYQDDAKFSEAKIELIAQNFTHPHYLQANSAAFVPGLSVIDALMNLGPEKVKQLLHTGRS